MPQYDLPLDDLVRYRSGVTPPEDLAAFWATTLAESRGLATTPELELVDTGLDLVDTYDVTFSGFGGDPIRAWYRRPRGTDVDLPVLVNYQWYSGGRGLPHQVGFWPLARMAVLEVDSRGQGTGGGYVSDTPDTHGSGPSAAGFATRGVLDPAEYYYRRVYTDAVLAVDAAQALPGVDGDRVAVGGISQGGGIALAVAGLHDRVTAVLADVPFLTDIPRGMTTAANGPYLELSTYLATHRDKVSQVLRTLSYVDATVLVPTASAAALFSVALMDEICPPSTVYAAYNAYGGPKEVVTYPFNDHEGGQFHHEAVQLRWLRERLGT